MQALFLSHGSPMLALENAPTTKFLQGLSSQLKTPKAILVISAHWEAMQPTITASQQPDLIYDFYGFPEQLYTLKYPVYGAPELAKTIQKLLLGANFDAQIDNSRGLDHGAWSPLYLVYPQANIPVLQLSLQKGQGALWHYNLGVAIAELSMQNILVIGSGNLTHNLHQAFRGGHSTTPNWVTEFAEWFAEKISKNDIEVMLNWQNLAPYAAQNHPTPEHLMPLFVILGIASANVMQSKRLHSDVSMGVLAMDSYLFSAN